MIESKAKGTMPDGPKCPQCGTALPSGVLAGLCPACLLKHGASADTAAASESPPFVPPPIEEIAKLLPQLEILALLGKGGMGAVYQARQPALDRFVALKLVPTPTGADPAFAERFTREARALARLNHPNIVTVYEFGQIGELHYLIMEFVDGANLRQLMQGGHLSAREALQIVPQLCDALQYAHDQGVVHRDIKPENVLVDRKGRVKIADFGLAKILGLEPGILRLTGEGHVMGTPHYMSPEQLEHPTEVDHRADIYSLGVVFYEMLTGELPLGKFPLPSSKVQIDVRLDDVVLRALEKEPARRYQHVSEVKTRMLAIAQSPGASAAQPPDGKPRKTKPAVLVLASCGAVLLLLVLVLACLHFLPRHEAPPWAPTLAPGEKFDGNKLLQEARSLTDQGQYQAALDRYLWGYNNALANHMDSSGVRLLWGYADWVELGRRYPKAKQALLDIRDRNARALAEGRGYFALFLEVQDMNQFLHEDDATLALFKKIHAKDPGLAKQCFYAMRGSLVQDGDYALFMEYTPDAQAAFEIIQRDWKMRKNSEDRFHETRARARKMNEEHNAKMREQHPDWQIPEPPPLAEPPRIADSSFVTKTRQLIEALVATGHKADAEKIRDEAATLLDDERLKSAVTDAEKKVGK